MCMKKLIFPFFIAVIAGTAFGQKESFHEDSRNFDIKLDFGGYSGTLKDNHTDSVHSTAAAAVILTPQMAWAVARSISLGGAVAYSRYLDTSASSMNGLDVNFVFDIHFLRTPRTDMMIGLTLGIAGIRLDANDGTGDVYGSMGMRRDLHLMARFYVTERIAIIANLAFPGYTFSKFGKNLNDTFTINMKGVGFGTGVAFKLLGQKTAGTARNK